MRLFSSYLHQEPSAVHYGPLLVAEETKAPKHTGSTLALGQRLLADNDQRRDDDYCEGC